MEHTKGPWKTSQESNDPEWAIVTDSTGNIVANVNSETGPDIPPLVSTKMPQQANARLIAAAPEMLEALKRLADHVYRANKDYEALSVAQAAIAKAEGK